MTSNAFSRHGTVLQSITSVVASSLSQAAIEFRATATSSTSCKTKSAILLGALLVTQLNTAHSAESFWQAPQSQSISSNSQHSWRGFDDLSASLATNRQVDIHGRQIEQNEVSISHSLTQASALTFEYAQAGDQRNFMLGYTQNNLSLSVMNGSGEDFASLSGDYVGLDPYMFHAGFKQEFRTRGYGVDYGLGRFGHVQFGQATVASDGLAERRARYLEWSGNSLFARVTRFARAGEAIGSGLDVGFAFGENHNKSLAVQAMQLEGDRSMQRIRLQFDASPQRQYWLDLSSHQNPLFQAKDDYRVMLNFKALFGGRQLASYQTDAGSGGDASDEGSVDGESTGQPAKKSGKGWKRAVFIGVGVAGAAALSSSGSSAQDTSVRFRTQTEAAFEVLNGINPQSIRLNKEYGGWVFINPDGGYASTNPVSGQPASVILPDRNLVIPQGSRSTATYHTHAAFDPRFDNENFSPTDLNSDRKIGVDGYLATPGGQFKFHNVTTGEVSTLGPIATE